MSAEVSNQDPWQPPMDDLYQFVSYQADNETAQTRDAILRALYGCLEKNLRLVTDESGNTGPANPAFYEEIKTIWSWTIEAHDLQDARHFARRLVHAFKAVETKEVDVDPHSNTEVWQPRLGYDNFPEGLDEVDEWQPFMDALVSDPDYAGQIWMYMGLPVAANVSSRSKIWKLSMLLYGIEGKGIEFGGSMGHNILRLVRSHEPFFLYDQTSVGEWNEHFGYVESKLATMAVNHALAQPVTFKRSVNVDMYDYAHRDSVYRHWAKSNSSSFEELLDPVYSDHLDALSKMTAPKLLQEDVLELDPRVVKKILRGPAHTGLASMMLNQVREPEKVPPMLDRMRSCIKKGGQLVVLDWRELHPDGQVATCVEAEKDIDNWAPFTLNWYVETVGSKQGLQKHGIIDNGRVGSIGLLQPALIAPRAQEVLGLTL